MQDETRDGAPGEEPVEALATVEGGLTLAAGDIPPDRHPAAVYLASLTSARSRETMRQALDRLAGLVHAGATAETLAWHRLRYQHTRAVMARLREEGLSPASQNKLRAALRRVLEEAKRLGLMSHEDCDAARDVPAAKGTRVASEALTVEELRALVAACDLATPQGARDAALLGLLFGGGLRRAEAVSVRFEGFNPHQGTVLVRGKGDKERQAPLAEDAVEFVSGWVRHRGTAPGPLLHPFSREGVMVAGRAVAYASVPDILEEIARRAGVRVFATHDARRTCITHMLDAGVDYGLVQQVAGHANIATTARYDRRKAETARRARFGLKMTGESK